MGQSVSSLCDFDSRNEQFWRIQLSSPRTRTNFALALEQANRRSIGKVQCRSRVTAGQEVPAGRDSKFALAGVYRVEVWPMCIGLPRKESGDSLLK